MRVPSQTLAPTTGLQAAQGPNIAPFQNSAPAQAIQGGNAMLRTGSQLILQARHEEIEVQKEAQRQEILIQQEAQKIQKQLDDARGKELYNEFATFADQVEIEFSGLSGKAAATQSMESVKKIMAKFKEIQDKADNDTQRTIFSTSGMVRTRSANSGIQKHALNEQRKFDIAETEARVSGFIRDASRYWPSWNEPAGDFAMYRGAAVKETRELANKLGIPEGSAQLQNMLVKAETQVVSQVVKNMVDANDYASASEYLKQEFEAGNVEEQAFQTLQSMVGGGFRIQRGTNAANQIYEELLLKSPNGDEGQPRIGDLLERAKEISDPEERKVAQTLLKQRHQQEVQAKKEEYRDRLNKLGEVAYSRVGGWRDIPASEFGALKPEDRSALMRGLPKTDDTETYLQIIQDPELMKPGSIEQFRPYLTEATYRKFAEEGLKPEKLLDVKINNTMLDSALLESGLYGLVTPKTDDQKKNKIRLMNELQTMISVEQESKGRKLTTGEARQVLNNVLRQEVIVPGFFSDTKKQIFGLEESERGNALIPVNGEKIPLSIFEKISQQLTEDGVAATPENISRYYQKRYKGGQ